MLDNSDGDIKKWNPIYDELKEDFIILILLLLLVLLLH